jgi:hypothetical protein
MQTKKITILISLLILQLTSFGQAPTNDECINAINVPININTSCNTFITGTTLGATQSMPGCGGAADDDVWYKFTATATSHKITATPAAATNGINDIVLQVLYGNCSTLTPLYCIDNTFGNNSEVETLTGLTIGDVYYIRIHSNDNLVGQGSFDICINMPTLAPANDDCTTATGLAVNSDNNCTNTTTGTTVAATESLTGCTGNADDDVWYSFVATNASHKIIITPAASNGLNDAVFQVFSGTCTALNSLSCVDNTVGTTTEEEIISGLIIGNTYYVRVYGFDSSTGQGEFNICVSTAAAPSISITASATNICANANITFTATASSYNPAPTYLWLKNGAPINTSSGNAVGQSYNDNTLVNNDAISCKLNYVDANGNPQFVISNSITITINPNCYCIPPLGSISFQTITNFSINGVANTSSDTPFDSYHNYYDSSSINFNSPQATLINFNINTSLADNYKRIWIDLNDNMSFDDPGELMFATTNKSIASVNGSFFLPPNAPTGNHRLRVRANQQPFTTSCGQSFGETEDYRINITAGNNCSGVPAASLIFASQYVVCTGSSTNVTAYANGLGISSQWQQSALPTSGFTNIAGAVNNTYAATAITANTYYKCIFTCANSGQSNASSVVAITLGTVPANDSVCNATQLVQGVFDIVNTTCATASDDNFTGSDICSTPNNTVWYKITPAVTERLRLKLNKVPNDPYPMDAWVNIFTATGNCSNFALTPVSPYPYNCLRANLPNDSSVIVEAGTYDGYPPSATGILQAGTTYYIRIDGYLGSFGALTITSLTPAITTNTWIGSANDAWENINNWSNHIIPDEYTNVIINNNAINYPKINSNVTVRSIKVNPASALTVLSGKLLKILH